MLTLRLRHGCHRLSTRNCLARSSLANQRFRSTGSTSQQKAKPQHNSNRDELFAALGNLKPQNEPYPRTLPQNKPYPGARQNYKRTSKPQNEPYPRALSQNGPYPGGRQNSKRTRHASNHKHSAHLPVVHKPPVITADQVVQFFQDKVAEWAKRPHIYSRLLSFGLPKDDISKLLKTFVREVEAGALSDPASQEYYHLARFTQPHDGISIDVIYSTTLFWWASKTTNQERLEKEFGIHPNTLRLVRQLVQATSRTFPADEFHLARSTHRKIIMHVGPTNSGKTHHALRALAAANSGVYAGPLRLLAHEIWTRLNSGQIVPLGFEEEAPKDPKGDPKYARPCNMITGEEQKIMEGVVPHYSCTVEMLGFTKRVDVAVIDEIQMLGDSDRGPGWLNAVVGTWASEVHLCGEETVVPLVQALLEHTGDEIEVRRYQRLTPLVVEEESLNGDFTKIRKGDCIVAFSRSSIFTIKKTVEEVTGMRCAVVYGRLPPEIRSEQAGLFNDPDSGYDVIIGSDAIGMGLNLKIKRVIFAATSKFDGQDVRPLAVSAVKQIAGRAGRYGLHKEQADLGGTTTTLFDEDLPHLTHCVAQPYTPLPYVHIGFHLAQVRDLLSVMPPGTPMHTIISAAKYIARLPPFVRYANDEHLVTACEFIDREWRDMTNGEKVSLLNAPVPWRDARTVEILTRLLKQQARGDAIVFAETLQGTGLLEMMEDLDRRMHMEEAGIPTRAVQVPNALMQMETLHKILVFYMWMSFRHPLIYSDSETVLQLKERLEVILNWTLDGLSKKLVKEHGLKGLMPLVQKAALENPPGSDMMAATDPTPLVDESVPVAVDIRAVV